MPNGSETAKGCRISNADLARRLADSLEDHVTPHENERVVRLMLLHLLRHCGDAHFAEEARLLIEMLES